MNKKMSDEDIKYYREKWVENWEENFREVKEIDDSIWRYFLNYREKD